ncbi:MAG: glycosyltransferase family 87 protein [Solirubrobacteraceae bacterium]
MRKESGQAESPVLLASGPVAGAGAGHADSTVALPGIGKLLNVPRPRVVASRTAGRLALSALILAALAVVVFAASGPSVFVPRSGFSFPNWEAGPLHGLIGRPIDGRETLNIGLSVLIVAMVGAYGIALAAVRTLSMRTIVIFVLVAHAVLLLGPPFQLTDVFNYLGYARLGGLHHLNPYTHVMAGEVHDPVYRFTSWHNLRSPYGPLFTVLSYPLAFLPLPVAYWVLKIVTVLTSLAFIWLVWKCARLLGRDPRFAVLFVAANPIFLMYGVAGFHNDFFMLVPSIGAIALLLARRDKAAGAALMAAVAVKFSAVLLLPFLLIAARPTERRLRVLTGAALAAIPLAALSLVFFGFSIPNLVDQSTLLTDFSVPNVVGDLVGLGGGTPGLLRVANVALVAAVIYLLRRKGGWLVGAGWATLALIISLAWLVPWYVIWLLPLAGLGTSIRLRRASLVLTAYLVIGFMPVTGMLLSRHSINLMGGPAGQASKALQQKLAG